MFPRKVSNVATPSHKSPFRRRSLFKAAGIGATGAAGLPLVSACGDIESGGGSTQVTEGFDFLPEYKEWPLPFEPDLVGEPPNHPSGFTSFPQPVTAVENLPSGSGTYEITVPMWGEPPSKDDPYYAAVSEAWGGTVVNLRHADGNTFAETSVQWLQANEFGDGIMMFSWMLQSHSNFQETVVNTFYDLTDLLKGDISERWPLLAGRVTEAWGKSVWSTDPSDESTARIYGIPGSVLGGATNAMFVRTDLLEDLGKEMPTTVDELLEIGRAYTDSAAGQWAFAGTDYLTPSWFGLASGDGWRWDEEQGKMLHNCERPEYTEWLEFRKTIWDEGLVHPDLPSGTLDGHELHKAGTILFSLDGMSWWSDYTNMVNNGEAEGAIAPLGALTSGGREPLAYTATDVEGWLFLRKDLEPEQVEEILDVANWCAAPFGTEEWQLLEYGVEGTHFDFDDDGNPIRTEEGISIVQAPVNYKTLSGEVQSFLTGDPEMVQALFDYNASLKDHFEENQFEGMRVEMPSAARTAAQALGDQENDIAYGRAELDSIPDMVETFLNNGGEEAREVFTQAYKTLHGE